MCGIQVAPCSGGQSVEGQWGSVGADRALPAVFGAGPVRDSALCRARSLSSRCLHRSSRSPRRLARSPSTRESYLCGGLRTSSRAVGGAEGFGGGCKGRTAKHALPVDGVHERAGRVGEPSLPSRRVTRRPLTNSPPVNSLYSSDKHPTLFSLTARRSSRRVRNFLTCFYQAILLHRFPESIPGL